MIFYYIIFLIISSFSFAKGRLGSLFFILVGVVLFFTAAFRGEGVDRDYEGYIEYYNDVLGSGFINVEPTFIIITEVVEKFFGSHSYLFITYALLGVSVKLYAIGRLTPHKNIALLVYFSGFFLLHEMTQIRIGVAAGLLLLCVKPIKDRSYRNFLFFSVLAFCFHYSAIIVFPLYFLRNSTSSLRYYSLLLPVALILYYLNFNAVNISEYIPIDLITLKIRTYEEYAFFDSSINILNALFLSRCLLAYLLFWRAKELARQNEYLVILLKIYFIGIFTFLAFASIPGISSRASELLFVVEIILIPALIGNAKEKILVQFLVIGISLATLTFFLFASELIEPYF